ncbi:MAG: hypothetical protein Q8P53_04065 [Candidatus Shapirobacteria bacterium]|nr:hypothetical protein [Candidatus Shapirobacteria bacterium]
MDEINSSPRPLSTSLSAQIILYLKALLLPPMGFFWGYRYFRQSDTKSKLIGLFTILITIIEIIWITQSTITAINTINQQVAQQSALYGL